jgi:hypothetical protein
MNFCNAWLMSDSGLPQELQAVALELEHVLVPGLDVRAGHDDSTQVLVLGNQRAKPAA